MKKVKSNVNTLTVIAFSVVGLAIIVGIGLTVLNKLGDAVGGTANTSIQYAMTQMGSTGLLGWLPVVIALLVGVFFLSYFMGKKS
jgi:hypothetical protein